MYIFDTDALILLFRFYPKRFPSLWAAFDQLIINGEIISVKEVLKEISAQDDAVSDWAKEHKDIFQEPSTEEAIFISEIFKVKHFQNALEARKRLKGGAFADPFVIAKAKVNSAFVVTKEKKKPHAAKIPRACHQLSQMSEAAR